MIVLATIGKYIISACTATGLPVCNCKAGRNGIICRHVKEFDPTAKNVWDN